MHIILECFQKAILENNSAALLEELKAGNSARLPIYSEGYRIRLLAALKADYPATCAVMGEAEFEKQGREYIGHTPSCSWNLEHYPAGLAESIALVFAGKPIASLALLEQAIARVFMGAESDPLDISILPALTSEQFAGLCLLPRNAGMPLTLAFPLHHWLEGWRKAENPPLPEAKEEYLYLYRHHNEVRREVLTASQFLLLDALFQGERLESALEKVLAEHPACQQEVLEHIQHWIPEWIGKGFFRQ